MKSKISSHNYLCTDDFGDKVYRCFYSGVIVYPDKAIFIGACMPNLKIRYVCDSVKGMPAFKASRESFNQHDANCNTCKNFKRLQHDGKFKGISHGFVKGSCNKVTSHPLVYNKAGQDFWVSPDDFMGMDCYVSRI